MSIKFLNLKNKILQSSPHDSFKPFWLKIMLQFKCIAWWSLGPKSGASSTRLTICFSPNCSPWKFTWTMRRNSRCTVCSSITSSWRRTRRTKSCLSCWMCSSSIKSWFSSNRCRDASLWHNCWLSRISQQLEFIVEWPRRRDCPSTSSLRISRRFVFQYFSKFKNNKILIGDYEILKIII